MAFNIEFFNYQCFKKGVSRTKVAADLGMSYPTFLKKINDESDWKLSEMERVAKYFGLNDLARDQLFGLGDQCDFSITNSLP